jgi:tRNA threonylcarbamoyladenosine biosynthesis protein TsaE
MKAISRSTKETERFAVFLLKEFSTQRPLVFALKGELGAGKTTFTKALASALGIQEKVSSPTFLLVRKYAVPKNKQFTHLVHIDAYRLHSGRELVALGLKEILARRENVVVIEWPEKVSRYLPSGTVELSLRATGPTERLVSWKRKKRKNS